MAGKRQPTALVKAKGKKHFTKAEIAARESSEIKVHADKVTAPSYLSKEQKSKFNKYKKELMKIDLVSNLDIDSLARYIVAESQYLKISAEISKLDYTIKLKGFDEITNEETTRTVVNPVMEDLLIMQDRCFKQCRQGASDFGLTITSRCRLVVPQPKEEKKNKFDKFTARKGKA